MKTSNHNIEVKSEVMLEDLMIKEQENNSNCHESSIEGKRDQFDIVNSLLYQDLTRLCFDIFCHLDTSSLSNCRLVCQQWKEFIDFNFFDLPRGQRWIRSRIINNILNKDYIPKEKIINHDEEMYGIEVDLNGICVTTYKGSISYYKSRTLTHIWTTKVFEALVQHHMTNTRVYAVSSDFDHNHRDSHLFILDRNTGDLLKKFETIHTDPILGVRAFEDQFIATVSCAGHIKFHEISTNSENDIFERREIFTEHTYKDLPPDVDGYTHLDIEGRKLISGSGIGELILWDLPTGTKIKAFDCQQDVQYLKMNWPYVATTAASLRLDQGIKLFDIEKEALVRHLIPDQYVSHVTFNRSIILATGIATIEVNAENQLEIITTHKFWSLDEVLDDSIETKDLQCHEMNSNSNNNSKMESSAILGSDVITTENKIIIQRSFWP